MVIEAKMLYFSNNSLRNFYININKLLDFFALKSCYWLALTGVGAFFKNASEFKLNLDIWKPKGDPIVMKKQVLNYGSALLATTALSSGAAHAGSIVTQTAAAAVPATTLTAAKLSAQVFGGTTTVQKAVTLGPTGVSLDFSNAYTTKFDVEIEGTNSDFTGTVAAASYATTAGGISILGGTAGCTVQVLTERILIEDCLVSSATAIDHLNVSGIAFNQANGFATAGASIALNAIVRGQSNNTFETLAARNLVTSQNSIKVSSFASTAATIRNSAVPPFSDLTGGATAFSMGVVTISGTGAVGTDLSTAITTGDALAGSMELTVTHGVLADAATTAIDVASSTVGAGAATASVRMSNFNGTVASFDYTASNTVIGSYDIEVNFDGTTSIATYAAGTVDVVFSAGTSNLAAHPAGSGTLAGLNRDGFSTQLNTVQSSAGNGSTVFQSFVRVVNNGSVAGAVSIVVRDDVDGSSYGTYTGGTIAANSTLQISMPTIETALGITAAGQYQLSLSGPFDGYAQHVMFNSVDNHFVDLSGFRAANP